MKYVLLLLGVGSLFAQEKKFKIEGAMKGMTEGAVLYLGHKYNDAMISDSAKVNNGKFTFSGKTEEPNMYWISSQKNGAPGLIFFIDGGTVQITGGFDTLAKSKIVAGPTQEDYRNSQKVFSKYAAERGSFIQRHNLLVSKGDAEGAGKIVDSAKAAERAYSRELTAFIQSHPNSNIGGYIIWSVTLDWPEITEYDAMYNALSEKVKKGKFGKLAREKIASLKGTTLGFPAIDFTLQDLDGKNVALSSFKGKYVLVDFWASWCGPCRRENPNVVAAYNKYKDKGFTILGVSLDDNKEKWKAAVEKDNLAWTHVSDLKGWQSSVAKMYNVTGIPFNLLLDKDGNILAKGLRGADLEAKLEAVLGK